MSHPFRIWLLVGLFSVTTIVPVCAQSVDYRRPGSQRDAVLCGGRCETTRERNFERESEDEERAQAREEKRQRDERNSRANAIFEQLNAAWIRGDFPEALRLAREQQAVRDNAEIRSNIAKIEAVLAKQEARRSADIAGQQAKVAFDRDDWVTAAALYRRALAADADYLTEDGKKWLQDLENRVSAGKAQQQAVDGFVQSRTATTATSGLGFLPADTMTVNAQDVPSGLPKGLDRAIATAYAGSPSGVGENVRKGFQAVMEHDWDVAKAWFQTALRSEPDNAGVKQLIAALESAAKREPGRAATPISPDAKLQLPLDTDVELLMVPAPSAANVQLPMTSELLFFPVEEPAGGYPSMGTILNRMLTRLIP